MISAKFNSGLSDLVFECIIPTSIALLEDDHSFEDASNSMEMISSDVLSVVTLKSINQILNFLLIIHGAVHFQEVLECQGGSDS